MRACSSFFFSHFPTRVLRMCSKRGGEINSPLSLKKKVFVLLIFSQPFSRYILIFTFFGHLPTDKNFPFFWKNLLIVFIFKKKFSFFFVGPFPPLCTLFLLYLFSLINERYHFTFFFCLRSCGKG